MSKKRILYLSVHEILEYDEVKLFSELGHEVYSLGAYTQPGGQENRKRPPLPDLPYNPHFIELSLQYPKERLHEEMLEGIDIVIIMHETKLVTNNWHLFKPFIDRGGRVIWRSIGQSVTAREDEIRQARAEGLEIVRYSPAEMTIKDNVGQDAMIRFYKDPDEYKDWNGHKEIVLNFTQGLRQRGLFVGHQAWRNATRGLPRVVYGPGNEDLGSAAGGLLSNDEQLQAYRDHRVYFYHGSFPASYTLTLIEAMMTGIPVVAVGDLIGNGPMFPDQKTYEATSIIQDGISGLIGNTTAELHDKLQSMLKDPKKAQAISAFGRARAIELFGKAKIKSEWEEYLNRGKS